MYRLRVLLSAIVIAVALMPGPVLANEEAPQATVELTRDATYSERDVAEIAEYLGVSLEEADLRLRLERASVGLEPELIKAFPDTFAGAWLNAKGEPGLTVALTADGDRALGVIQSLFALPEYVSTVTVEHALRDLIDLQETMIADRAALQAGNARDGMLSALSATKGEYDLDIDVHRNTVVIRVEEPNELLATRFADLYGAEMVVVEGNRSSPSACTRQDCRYTLQGGLRVANANDIGCSSGFSTFQPGSSFYYLLSAAHCTLADRYHGGEWYGYVSSQYMGGPRDVEAHYRPSTGWFMSATIFVEPTDIRPVRYHITWANTMQGTIVGKSGQATNTTRGNILSKYHAPWYVPSSYNFITASFCVSDGDSGGSVFNTNTAYGIVSGSGGFCGVDAYGIFGNIVYATDALGVAVLASP